MALTYYRLERVEEECGRTSKGPWVDKLDDILTPEEKAEIIAHWKTLSGESCFVSAMFDLKLILRRKAGIV
jgi:hypothetical protein